MTYIGIRAFLLSVIGLAILAFLTIATFAGWDNNSLNRLIDTSNFIVNDGCSGTLIRTGSEPVVLTAAHCVADLYEEYERESVDADGTVTKKKVKVAVPGRILQMAFDGALELTEKSYRVKVLASDKRRDLAVVQALVPIYQRPATIGCVAPTRGEHILVVGNPKGALYASVVDGIVSSNRRTYSTIRAFDGPTGNADQPLMQVSAGVVSGNSGGALYNDDLELVGVPVMAHTVNEVLGFAVPLEEIHVFLKSAELGQLVKHCEETVDTK